MYTFLLVVDVLVSVTLVGLVLLQQGKGADAGAAFGSGASGTVFGARGSANFLSRATAVCATIFFVVSLSLAYMVQGQKSADSVVERVGAATAGGAPAAEPLPEEGSEPSTPQVPE